MSELAIFTKPWKTLSLPDLAEHIKSLGFDHDRIAGAAGFPGRAR